MGGSRTVGGIIFGQSGQTYSPAARIYIEDDNALDVLTLKTSSGTPTITTYNTTNDISIDVAGDQGLYKTGPGRLNLNLTPKSYTGTTQINQGSLLIDSALASRDFVVDEDGELFLSGTFTQQANSISSSGLITLSRATLDVNSSSDQFISGVIKNGSLPGNLSKSGTGRLTLEGANTYTGATNVYGGVLEIASGGSLARGVLVRSGGTLQVDGAISTAGTYSTTVYSGGTLTGTGTIGGATTITVGATHSPGNSPGVQTFENNLTYQAGSTLVWELITNSTAPADRGVTYDGVDVAGNLTFSGSTTVNLTFNLEGSSVDWTDALWDSSITGTDGWKIFSVEGSTTGAENLALAGAHTLLDSNGVSLASVRPAGDGHVAAYFFVTQVGSDVYLNYSVPEPDSLLLGGLGTLALFRRRRRN